VPTRALAAVTEDMPSTARVNDRPQVPADPVPGHFIATRLARTIVVVSAAFGPNCHGMTADSFTLLSQNPLLVMVAVGAGGRTHHLLESATGFGVSVLAEEQAEVATHFASRRRAPGIGQFHPVRWETAPRSGAPVLTDALAWLDCERRGITPAGDHVLVIGEVVQTRTRAQPGWPLVRYGGRFQALHPSC
jgi:flavin reductase (DIM6/NTAB) family NADH-FMN oxidoreductase RutF